MDIVQICFSPLNAWKEFQFDFNIVSIEASLQNVVTQMEAKTPHAEKGKRNSKLEDSFNMEKDLILRIRRAKAIPPSSFTDK